MSIARLRSLFSKARVKISSLLVILLIVGFTMSARFVPVAAHPDAQTNPPAPAGWKAYNDSVFRSLDQYIGTNVTTIGVGNKFTGVTSGELLDQATGLSTGVTATLTQSGGVTWNPKPSTGGYDPAAGTDAYNTFHGLTDMTGVIEYGNKSGWYVDLTFTGLDPEKQYSFATSAARSKSTFSNYNTLYSISGVDAATNGSSTGVTIINDFSVSFNTGDNHASGYVARWTHIQPGQDGTFVVRATHQSTDRNGYRAFAFSVFMLEEEVPVEYTLTLHTQGYGTFYVDPPANSFYDGNTLTFPEHTVVQIQAVALVNWHFVEWSGDLTGSDVIEEIVMTENKDITAHFEKNFVILDVQTIGNGHVDRTAADPYHLSDAVQLTAVPDTGWVFKEWQGDLTGTTNPQTILLNTQKYVVAVFVPGTTMLTVNIIGQGEVLKAPGDPYNLSDAVELTAVPAEGWHFVGWSGDLSGDENPTIIILNTYKIVNATFEKNQP